jgi:peptidoglycan/xylan/chitin deacetylase (PgdA/CDA1 family)
MHPIWNLVSILTARRIYTRARTHSRKIYLTFDDGPDPDYTPRIAKLLAKYRAQATFFLQGASAERHGDIVSDLVAGGHTLGNHSYSHTSFKVIGEEKQVEEIDRTDALLRNYDGHDRHVFRPPYGHLNIKTIALCIRRRQPVALWTHDSFDYRLTAAEIVERMTDLPLRSGDIILFHDDGMPALDALERLLPQWRDSGFEFGVL